MHSRVLSAAEAKAMTPGSTESWIGGVHSPTDGKAEPALRVPAIAEGARRLGATIYQDCAARGLETTAGRVSAVVTEKGTIRTSAVLVAGGVWTSMFCRHHGIDMPLAGVRSTSFFTAPAPEITPGGLSTPDITFRRRLDGGYTIGIAGRGLLELTPQGSSTQNRSGAPSRSATGCSPSAPANPSSTVPRPSCAGATTASRRSSACAPMIRRRKRS